VNLLTRIFRPSTVKAAEGQYRDGPWHLHDGSWLPASWGRYWNYWQLGYDPISGGGNSAMVEACVSAYAQTIAMCPGSHWRTRDDGGRERVVNSALNRIIRKPNAYQTISDFLLNLVRSLYLDGNAYALAIRNDRFEIGELHLMQSRSSGVRFSETGDVFYALGGNDVIERQVGAEVLQGVPARDVLHVRLQTPRHPLKGETPLTVVALDVASRNAMMAQQLAFYSNQSRPSQVLSTDHILTKEQVTQLRDLWNEQSQGLNQGGTPILSAGLKPLPLGTSPQDAQLAELMKMSEQSVAIAYRVPLAILGLGGQTYSSTEALMQQWIASGLGFALNHIEEAFGLTFGLRGQPDEYLEFDTEALLRSSFKDRIDALAKGVVGGIFAPNEARRKEGYADAEAGDEPRVQQQVVPLSAWDKAAAEPAPPALAAPPAPGAMGGEPDEPEKDSVNADTLVRWFRDSYARYAA
jgi:HK97 family phage portal protein